MYQNIVSEVLKNLRGQSDCMATSKKLGYNYNQYFKFEAGYKILRMNDFFMICRELDQKIVVKAFREALDIELVDFTQEELIYKFCEKWGNPTEYVLSHELDMSLSKWWRIRNNKSSLSFMDFLKLADVTTGRMINFLNYFIPEPTLAQKLHDKESNIVALNFLQKYPEAALILTGVYINEYIQAPLRSKMQVLQKLTGLGEEKFDFLIENLIRKGICYTDTKGNINATEYKIEVRDPNANVSISLFKLITDVQQKASLTLGRKDSLLKCNLKIASTSEEGQEKIVAAIRDCYQNICKIIESVHPKDRDRIIMMQQALTWIDSQK